jgi:hypothetical protein
MSSSTAVTVSRIIPKDKQVELVKNTVKTLVETPMQFNKKTFLACLTQGSNTRKTLIEVIEKLAKNKTLHPSDLTEIGERVQSFIHGTPLQDVNVLGIFDEVNAQQQAALEALTPEELAAYNALSPEELAEHAF